MTKNKLREQLLQATKEESLEIFQETMRMSVRLALHEMMAEEVNELCGSKHYPNGSKYKRAGNESGRAYLEGKKESVIRPRVRTEAGEEIRLASYEAASSQQNLYDEVIQQVCEGISMRGLERAGKKKISKSAIARMWVGKSLEQLDYLRSRDLSQYDFIALMIDGVRLAEGVWIIIALGIDISGKKLMLDFEEGSSENGTVVGELIRRLKKRGVDEPKDRKLLIVRDGSPSIKAAVNEHWPKAVQQECLIHMQRHTRKKLRTRDRADFDNHCKALREAQGKEAGVEAFEDLIDFLSERNAAAALALRDRREDLLGFHDLDVDSTLNVTFLNTNCIENSIGNWREATHNIKRWNTKNEMVSRWSASGMLWAENGFNKIRHAEDLGKLAAALATPEEASSLRSESSSGVASAQKTTCQKALK